MSNVLSGYVSNVKVWLFAALIVLGSFTAFGIGFMQAEGVLADCSTQGGGAQNGDTGGSNSGGTCPPPKLTECPSTGCVGVKPDSITPLPDRINSSDMTFEVPCTEWATREGGYVTSGNWNLNSTCNILRTSIWDTAYAVGGGDPAWRNGTVLWNGVKLTSSSMNKYDTCAPQSRFGYQMSAYSKTYHRNVKTHIRLEKVIFKYRGPAGTDLVVTRLKPPKYTVNYNNISCNTPAPVVAETLNCFYGYGGNAYFSTDRNTIRSGGRLVQNRGVLPGDPRTPVWHGEDHAPSCDKTGSARVSIKQKLNENGYGYYRTMVSWKYDTYQRTDFVGGGRVFLSKWKNTARNISANRRDYFTYSCNSDRPYEGPFTSTNIPDRNSYFNSATCPQVNWRCELHDSTTAGLDRSTLPPGQTYTPQNVSVMRNGEIVPITFASLRVVDYSGGRTDITDGGGGNSARNISNIEYQNFVKAGSTPFYGTNVNASDQYFKLHPNASNKNGTERWNSWLSHHNNNLNKSLSFNWASDSGKPFQAERQYRVTGEFNVPRIGGDGTGDNFGNTSGMVYNWVRGSRDCMEYNGAGQQTGARLTSTSNPINVLRAVNK